MSAADERAKVLKAVRVDFDKALILAENVLTLGIVVNHLQRSLDSLPKEKKFRSLTRL